jgi:hypothetical protein
MATQLTAAATLGLSIPQLLAVARNPSFPKPTASVNGVITWADADIAAFATVLSAVRANGWRLNPASLPTLPIAVASTKPVGPGYRPAGDDPLFDL